MVRRFGARAARMVRDGAAGLYSIMREMVRARMPAGPVELQPLGSHQVEKPELAVPAYHRLPLDSELAAVPAPAGPISSVAFDDGGLEDPAGSVSEGEEKEEQRKNEIKQRLEEVELKLRLVREKQEAVDRTEMWIDYNRGQERLSVIEEGSEEDYPRFRDEVRKPLQVVKGPRTSTPLDKIAARTENWTTNLPEPSSGAGVEDGLADVPAAGAGDWITNLPELGSGDGDAGELVAVPAAGARDWNTSLPEPGSAAGDAGGLVAVPALEPEKEKERPALEPEKEKEKVSARIRLEKKFLKHLEKFEI